MRIDEEISDDGRVVALELQAEAEGFSLWGDRQRIGFFAAEIIRGVVRRYARPVESELRIEGERLVLGAGESLIAWRYRSPVELEYKLYLVLETEDQPPLAVLARQVANALRFLTRNE